MGGSSEPLIATRGDRLTGIGCKELSASKERSVWGLRVCLFLVGSSILDLGHG